MPITTQTAGRNTSSAGRMNKHGKTEGQNKRIEDQNFLGPGKKQRNPAEKKIVNETIRKRQKFNAITDPEEFWNVINGTVLNTREREVLLLKRLENMTHQEIAEKLNISERLSQQIYSEAINKLRGVF